MAPKQTDPQFKLRMTPRIKEDIDRSAIANNRSMNAEILQRLERSLIPDLEIVSDLTHRNLALQHEIDHLTRLLLQLTPAERRVLEERLASFDQSSEQNAEWIAKHLSAKPIGKLQQD